MGCGCANCQKSADGFTIPTAACLRSSLAQRLVPIVDRARDRLTALGFRPYRVRIIRTRFAGPRRGMGPESVVHEMEILPTPKVVDMRSLAELVTPAGVNEQGVIQVEKISGRYTEEQLIGVGPDGTPVAPNETVYWEIEFFRRDGSPAEKRRFVRDSIPTFNPSSVEWQVALVNVLEKRNRLGEPEG